MKLILHNGNIITMDEECKKATAVAMEAGKIIAVGDEDKILKLADSRTQVIDLHLKTVIPGFNDSHLHNVKYGIFTACCDLSECCSLQELIETTRSFIEEEQVEAPKWVVGKGWNQDKFDCKVFPERKDLDRISTEHPIVLFRCCSHALVVNSKALEVLKLNSATPQVEGGAFDLENGLFREKAKDLVQGAITSYDVATLKGFIKKAGANLLAQGITSIQTDDFNMSVDYNRIIRAYSELAAEGDLPVRVTQQCLVGNLQQLEDFLGKGLKGLNVNDFYRIGCIKILADGSLGARTAALKKPYCDAPDTNGMLVHEAAELEKMVEMAHRAGFPVAIHCIGDRAAALAIQCIEKAKKNWPDSSLRHGIVHCQIEDDAILDKFRELELLAYVQPIFLDYDLHIVEQRVGKKLAKTSYNFKRMVDDGVHLSMGTDSPVERFDPLPNIYCAVTRKDKNGQPPQGFYPEQCLSIEESVRAYTCESAYCSYEEEAKGKVKAGYFADLTVLSDNIFEMTENPERLLQASTEMTVVGGDIVYDRFMKIKE